MNLRITIQKDVSDSNIPEDGYLQAAIRCAILDTDYSGEITLCIVDNESSQQLNQQYRQKNKPTNILSFSYNEAEYLGDLILCWPIVLQEARAQGKSLKAHLTHLLIHGTLHLQGFDHIQNDERNQMEQLEINLLNQLGIKNPYEEEPRHER